MEKILAYCMYAFMISRVNNREGECLTLYGLCKMSEWSGRRVNHYKECPSRLKFNINNCNFAYLVM